MTNPSTYPPKAAYASDWRDAVRPPPGYRVKTTLALRSALLTLAATVRTSTTRTFVRCMYCHYVFDDQRDAFETIIVHLNRLGEFIDTKHCLQMIKGEREIDGRYFHLSFDDGFRNNLTNALPILTKHRIPCIFFIPSSLIDAPPEEVERYCRVSTEHIAPIEMLTWNDIRQLASAGYDIGSHTKTHHSQINLKLD